MPTHVDYAINTDIRYGPLEVIDAERLAQQCGAPWWNQTVGSWWTWRSARWRSSRARLLVPRGARHRTRAPARTVVLMVEAATVVPPED
jgi:hypothetical protein